MIKVTTNILFVSWFGLIIILDIVARIFDIHVYTMSTIILIVSGIILYAIHKVSMNEKNDV